jgi:hypothetical protein
MIDAHTCPSSFMVRIRDAPNTQPYTTMVHVYHGTTWLVEKEKEDLRDDDLLDGATSAWASAALPWLRSVLEAASVDERRPPPATTSGAPARAHTSARSKSPSIQTQQPQRFGPFHW